MLAHRYYCSVKKNYGNLLKHYTTSIQKVRSNKRERQKIIEAIQIIQQKKQQQSYINNEREEDEHRKLLTIFEAILDKQQLDIKNLESLQKSLSFFRRLSEYAWLSINEINHTECKVEKILEDLEGKFKRQQQLSEDSTESIVLTEHEDDEKLFDAIILDTVRSKYEEDSQLRLECNPSTSLLDYYDCKDQHTPFESLRNESQRRKLLDRINVCCLCGFNNKKRVFARNRCSFLEGVTNTTNTPPHSTTTTSNNRSSGISLCVCDKELYPICLDCLLNNSSNRLRSALLNELNSASHTGRESPINTTTTTVNNPNSILQYSIESDTKEPSLSNDISCIVACPICKGGICCYDFFVVTNMPQESIPVLPSIVQTPQPLLLQQIDLTGAINTFQQVPLLLQQQPHIPQSLLSFLPTSDPNQLSNIGVLDDTELTANDDIDDEEEYQQQQEDDEEEDEDEEELMVLDELHDNADAIDNYIQKIRSVLPHSGGGGMNQKKNTTKLLCNVLSAINKRITNIKSTLDETSNIIASNSNRSNDSNHIAGNGGNPHKVIKRRGPKSCSKCHLKGHTSPTCPMNLESKRHIKLMEDYSISGSGGNIMKGSPAAAAIIKHEMSTRSNIINNNRVIKSEKSYYDPTTESMMYDVSSGDSTTVSSVPPPLTNHEDSDVKSVMDLLRNPTITKKLNYYPVSNNRININNSVHRH